jgi:hypothetical protein
MSTSRLDRLASAAADELLDTAATGTDTVARRAELDRVRRNRRGARLTAVVAVMASVAIALLVQGNFFSDSDPQPMKPLPGIDIADVPVWYDDAGLHRGNIVEQTPVDLAPQVGQDIEKGALALVRTGALYLDPANGDVWFHPWGGDPRIVGHNSLAGPGADPNGDIAVWFEESELVVYDTDTGRELARNDVPGTRPFVCEAMCAEHLPLSNGFTQVSTDRVAWTPIPFGSSMTFYDPQTGEVSIDSDEYIDVHDNAAMLSGEKYSPGPVLKVPGQEAVRYRELEPRARFSPSGNYVLSVGSGTHQSHGTVIRPHDAVIIDAATGDLWPAPRGIDYPWIAWSYGDIAMVNFGDRQEKLLACDAAQRTCESFPVERPILMPTN